MEQCLTKLCGRSMDAAECRLAHGALLSMCIWGECWKLLVGNQTKITALTSSQEQADDGIMFHINNDAISVCATHQRCKSTSNDDLCSILCGYKPHPPPDTLQYVYEAPNMDITSVILSVSCRPDDLPPACKYSTNMHLQRREHTLSLLSFVSVVREIV